MNCVRKRKSCKKARTMGKASANGKLSATQKKILDLRLSIVKLCFLFQGLSPNMSLIFVIVIYIKHCTVGHLKDYIESFGWCAYTYRSRRNQILIKHGQWLKREVLTFRRWLLPWKDADYLFVTWQWVDVVQVTRTNETVQILHLLDQIRVGLRRKVN